MIESVGNMQQNVDFKPAGREANPLDYLAGKKRMEDIFKAGDDQNVGLFSSSNFHCLAQAGYLGF